MLPRIDEDRRATKRIDFLRCRQDFEETVGSEQKTRRTGSPGNELALQTQGELTINGVQISRAEDRPTLAELQRLINDETARTNVQAEIDADGNLALESTRAAERRQ